MRRFSVLVGGRDLMVIARRVVITNEMVDGMYDLLQRGAVGKLGGRIIILYLSVFLYFSLMMLAV